MNEVKARSIKELHTLYMDFVKTEIKIKEQIQQCPHFAPLYRDLLLQISKNKHDLKTYMRERHQRVLSPLHVKAIWGPGIALN